MSSVQWRSSLTIDLLVQSGEPLDGYCERLVSYLGDGPPAFVFALGLLENGA